LGHFASYILRSHTKLRLGINAPLKHSKANCQIKKDSKNVNHISTLEIFVSGHAPDEKFYNSLPHCIGQGKLSFQITKSAALLVKSLLENR